MYDAFNAVLKAVQADVQKACEVYDVCIHHLMTGTNSKFAAEKELKKLNIDIQKLISDGQKKAKAAIEKVWTDKAKASKELRNSGSVPVLLWSDRRSA